MADAPALPMRKCEFAEMPGVTAKRKTVGDIWVLQCEGLLDQALGDGASVQFTEPADAYTLKILQVKKSTPSEMVMLVTGYKPGQYTDKKITITDGRVAFQTEGLSWQVESVLEQLEKPEPFPAFGPFRQSYPIWIWVALAVILAVPTLVLTRFLRKRRQKQRLIDNSMLGLGPALSPYQDFSKEHRRLTRLFSDPTADRGPLLGQIDKAFRLYLLRTCLVPVFDWQDRAVLKDIAKNNKVIFDAAGADIRRTLQEMVKAQGQALTGQDYEQLLALVQKTVDRMDHAKPRRSQP